MLYEKVKQDLVLARKSKDSVSVSVLSTLIGELGRGGEKEPADDKVISVAKKMISNIDQNMGVLVGTDLVLGLAIEKNILLNYVPKQLDERDLINIISHLKAEDPSIKLKDIMNFLKEHHGGAYDGRLAAQLAK